jgi:hypothetical protein
MFAFSRPAPPFSRKRKSMRSSGEARDFSVITNGDSQKNRLNLRNPSCTLPRGGDVIHLTVLEARNKCLSVNNNDFVEGNHIAA